jgi:hypothetical protein
MSLGRRAQSASQIPDLIGDAVSAALAKRAGDLEAATAALLRRAVPDTMALLDATGKGGRYNIVAHPWIPDVLRKRSARGADQIGEARPKWTRPELPAGRHEVTAPDINGACLSALRTHLPIGRLEHTTGLPHDRRRAGVQLITPPAWDHEHTLPNPQGSRDEPGPLRVTEPALRLLLRLSSLKYGLCDPPQIHPRRRRRGGTVSLHRAALTASADESEQQPVISAWGVVHQNSTAPDGKTAGRVPPARLPTADAMCDRCPQMRRPGGKPVQRSSAGRCPRSL